MQKQKQKKIKIINNGSTLYMGSAANINVPIRYLLEKMQKVCRCRCRTRMSISLAVHKNRITENKKKINKKTNAEFY